MSAEASHEPAFHAGWIDEGNVVEALERLLPRDGMTWCYISCVDSTPDVYSSPMLHEFMDRAADAGDAERVGQGVAVRGALLRSMLAGHFFNGFDEVWLCHDLPQTPKPEEVILTSERPAYRQGLARVQPWLQANRCLVGLGDGDGLNFVTLEPSVASQLTHERSAPMRRTLQARSGGPFDL